MIDLPPRAGRGSLTGRWEVRSDRLPGFRGVLALEQDVKAGDRLWLTAWVRQDGIGCEFLSIAAELAGKGGRRR
jgi:hypothetical protein